MQNTYGCWSLSIQNPYIWYYLYYLGGGFKDFLFSSLAGEMIHFDWYFSNGLKPPTSCIHKWTFCISLIKQDLPFVIMIVVSKPLVEKNPANQLIWKKYPITSTIQTVVGFGISEPSTGQDGAPQTSKKWMKIPSYTHLQPWFFIGFAGVITALLGGSSQLVSS